MTPRFLANGKQISKTTLKRMLSKATRDEGCYPSCRVNCYGNSDYNRSQQWHTACRDIHGDCKLLDVPATMLWITRSPPEWVERSSLSLRERVLRKSGQIENRQLGNIQDLANKIVSHGGGGRTRTAPSNKGECMASQVWFKVA